MRNGCCISTNTTGEPALVSTQRPVRAESQRLGLRLEKKVVKNHGTRIAFCLGLFQALAAAVHAQEDKSIAPLPARVGWVTDSRSSDTDACCQVELIFTNDVVGVW
jgi:hypothetical protein